VKYTKSKMKGNTMLKMFTSRFTKVRAAVTTVFVALAVAVVVAVPAMATESEGAKKVKEVDLGV